MKIRDRIKELRRVKASELLPNPKNWRTHPEAQQNAMRGILAEVGIADAVLARETPAGLMLIDGHLRAEIDGDTEWPVLVLDVDEAEADLILATHDPLAAMATTDAATLDALLREVNTSSEELQQMLSDLAEDAGLYQEDEPTEITEDEVPEPPEEPVTKTGDLWLLGEHRLLCGDSTNAEDVARLMNGTIGEMLFTDPPYGVNYEGGHFHSGDVNIKRKREKLEADNDATIYERFLPVACSVVNGPCYVWFAASKARTLYNVLAGCGAEIHAMIVWHKTNATYAALMAHYKQRHEPCLYFKPKNSTLRWCGESTESTVWSMERDAINELHPTQKPIRLAAKAIANHNAKNVVDFFAGSGSTLIAAEQLGRVCFAMEISPAYCDVIVARWEKLTGRKATLAK